MKRIAILGLILPLCLAIRVKEFVYDESNILESDGTNFEEIQQQVFAFDNNEEAFIWQDIPSEVLDRSSEDLIFPNGMFGAYPVPKEEHLASNAEGKRSLIFFSGGITAEL
ncbi:unnamed protein product, partial [Callosobruchus maculatus]